MSSKKSQAIPKCFIDLKNSVWFTLGSEDETMVCDTLTEHLYTKLLNVTKKKNLKVSKKGNQKSMVQVTHLKISNPYFNTVKKNSSGFLLQYKIQLH